jgi:hypothetical protein
VEVQDSTAMDQIDAGDPVKVRFITSASAVEGFLRGSLGE